MRLLLFVDESDHEYLRSLPKGAKRAIGGDIRRLQQNERPLQWKLLSGFGPGIGELKRGNLRVVITLADDRGAVWVVCTFLKDAKSKSRMRAEHKTLIETRLRRLRQLLSSGPTRH